MKEEILEKLKYTSIEELIKSVNEAIGKELSIIEVEDNMKKWDVIKKLLLLEEENKKKILSFVEFVNTLLIPIEEKAAYVISLCGLLEFGKISLTNYDIGSLFMVADYYRNASIETIKNTIPVIGNPKLLSIIRNKTLDLVERRNLLVSIIKYMIDNKTVIQNQNELTKFVEDRITEINLKEL